MKYRKRFRRPIQKNIKTVPETKHQNSTRQKTIKTVLDKNTKTMNDAKWNEYPCKAEATPKLRTSPQ